MGHQNPDYKQAHKSLQVAVEEYGFELESQQERGEKKQGVKQERVEELYQFFVMVALMVEVLIVARFLLALILEETGALGE